MRSAVTVEAISAGAAKMSFAMLKVRALPGRTGGMCLDLASAGHASQPTVVFGDPKRMIDADRLPQAVCPQFTVR